MPKSFLSDALIYGGVDFLWKFINFALFPLLAILLTVSEFGLYTLMGVQTWLVVMLINCGLHVSLEKFYLAAETHLKSRSELISASLTWLTLFGSLLVIGGLGLSYIFHTSFIEIPWKCFAIALATALPMSLFHYLCNVCRVNFSPWKYAGLHFFQNLLALSVGFYLILVQGKGVEGLLWGTFISFILLLPFAYRAVAPTLSFNIDLPLSKKILMFGLPFLFNDLARWTYGWLDRFWLEQFATLHAVGLFGMAFKLATPLIFLITAFNLAWSPYALKESDTRSPFLLKSNTFWFVFLTACAVPLILFSSEILHLLTPPAFWDAAALVPFLAVGLVFLGSSTVTQMVLIHTNQTKKIALIAWLGGCINCLGNYYLIPSHGAQGAAFAVLLTYFFIGGATWWLTRASFTEIKPLLGCVLVLALTWWGSEWTMIGKIGLLLFSTGALALQLCFSFLFNDHLRTRSWNSSKAAHQHVDENVSC